MTWLVTVDPRDPKIKIKKEWGPLQELDDTVSMDELAGAVETTAYVMEREGKMPITGDWKEESLCRVGKRIGRFTYVVYLTCFEQEHEKGLSAGAGYLRVMNIGEDE